MSKYTTFYSGPDVSAREQFEQITRAMADPECCDLEFVEVELDEEMALLLGSTEYTVLQLVLPKGKWLIFSGMLFGDD